VRNAFSLDVFACFGAVGLKTDCVAWDSRDFAFGVNDGVNDGNDESSVHGDHGACAEPARFASLLSPSGRCLDF